MTVENNLVFKKADISDIDLLVKIRREARNRKINQISLEATEMGRPLYERYGFTAMEYEMELR
jgi:hypothetical protein